MAVAADRVTDFQHAARATRAARLARCYRRLDVPLRALLVRHTRSIDDAEDLAQEVFLRLWRIAEWDRSGASALGVDIVQNCEVTGFDIKGGRVRGVSTSRGPVRADRVVMSVAGNSSELARLAGLRLPITTMALQAMVTEPVKPVLDVVINSATVHAYVSQSDRGEIVIGAGADAYNSYAQRGGLPQLRATISSVLQLFPSFSRLRLMRQWAGRVDITPDTSPLMGPTPVPGLFINCGWGTGGYKAIPAGGDTMAHTLATGHTHPLISAFGLQRFRTGALIDEGAATGVAH